MIPGIWDSLESEMLRLKLDVAGSWGQFSEEGECTASQIKQAQKRQPTTDTV